jgi:hypothetical protein
LRYTGDLERLEDHYNKEEKYWKRFSENSSSIGNQNLNKEEDQNNRVGIFSSHFDEDKEESESVKEISPLPKVSKKLLHTLEKQFEEEKFIFSQIGQEDMVWGKGVLNKIEEKSFTQSKQQ